VTPALPQAASTLRVIAYDGGVSGGR
jgi:hypothetical protein